MEGGASPAAEFLLERGFPPGTPREKAPGGRVEFLRHLGIDYALKIYPPAEEGDYLREARFYGLAGERARDWIPQRIARDDQRRVLLLSRLEGRRPRAGEIGRGAVREAGRFLAALPAPEGGEADRAPGACLSIGGHLEDCSARVAQAQQGEAEQDLPLRMFLNEELEPVWKRLLGSILEQCRTAGMDPLRELEPGQLVLSPGRFGFHNALLSPRGRWRFLGFGRSGADDPARMLCRFFCEGPLPPGEDLWEEAVEPLSALGRLDSAWAARSRILLPAYQVRRAAAPVIAYLQGGGESSRIRLSSRLLKARQWLAKAHRSL